MTNRRRLRKRVARLAALAGLSPEATAQAVAAALGRTALLTTQQRVAEAENARLEAKYGRLVETRQQRAERLWNV